MLFPPIYFTSVLRKEHALGVFSSLKLEAAAKQMREREYSYRERKLVRKHATCALWVQLHLL